MKKAKSNKAKKTKGAYNKGDKIPRIPRPMGLTNLLRAYHRIPDPNQKQIQLDKIQRLIINQWSSQGMMLMDKHVSIQDLSTYLNLPVQIVMTRANEQLMRVANIMEGDKIRAFTRAQFLGSFFRSLETQSLIRDQAKRLLVSQGDGYSPFISAEVNKALSNLISAEKPIQDLIKLTMEKNTINPIVQLEVNVDKQSNTYITTDEAISQIRSSSRSLMDDSTMLAAKESELLALPEGLPNINARTQDLTGIGLKNASTYDSGTENRADVGPKSEGQSSAERHRKRHEDEVLDEEDFRA